MSVNGWRFASALLVLILLAVAVGCRAPASSLPVSSPLATPSAVESTRPAPTPSATPVQIPSEPARSTSAAVPTYTFRIVRTYPHDPAAFTEGLVYQDGSLYESTGLLGKSTLRKVDLQTGRVLHVYSLPESYFGEGIAVVGDRIVQLTWQSNLGFVYDRDSFKLLTTFTYPTEGWGLTYDGKRLVMSDGTATLQFLDPETFKAVGQLEVRDLQGPVTRLNELEFVQGEVWANVWKTDRIARIDPSTGLVTGWIDLAGLLNPQDVSQPVDVLNGIAYDARQDRLFVTGKLWPALFEIKLVLRP